MPSIVMKGVPFFLPVIHILQLRGKSPFQPSSGHFCGPILGTEIPLIDIKHSLLVEFFHLL